MLLQGQEQMVQNDILNKKYLHLKESVTFESDAFLFCNLLVQFIV